MVNPLPGQCTPASGAIGMTGFEIEYPENTLMFLAVIFAALDGFDLFDTDGGDDGEYGGEATSDDDYVGTLGADIFVETAPLSRLYDLFDAMTGLRPGSVTTPCMAAKVTTPSWAARATTTCAVARAMTASWAQPAQIPCSEANRAM